MKPIATPTGNSNEDVPDSNRNPLSESTPRLGLDQLAIQADIRTLRGKIAWQGDLRSLREDRR